MYWNPSSEAKLLRLVGVEFTYEKIHEDQDFVIFKQLKIYVS